MTGARSRSVGRAARAATGRDLAVERATALAAAPGPLLVVTDFDGTLAPIVLQPEAARIIPGAARALRGLAAIAERRPDRLVIAVLSGRTARDVADQVRVGGVRYLGSHGIETGRLPRGARAERLEVTEDTSVAGFGPRMDALAEAIPQWLGRPSWLFVEPKGASLGLHYRRAQDPDRARLALLEALDAVERELGISGLARLESRRVVELRPVGALGKGGAVEQLIDEIGARAVLALGDDRTDAEAFRVIAERRAAVALDALLVGVAAAGELPDETPPEIEQAADLMIATPADAAAVLAAVARVLGRESD